MTKVSVVLLGLLLAIGGAHAQENYNTSSPGDGEVLKVLPTPMEIIFSTDIHLTGLRLVDANGKDWPIAWTKTDENVYGVKFQPIETLTPGKYVIEWQAYVRQHGHADGGGIRFTYAP